MSLSLSQLIVACGDDKVEFQSLDQCAVSLDYSAKHGNRITFGTTMNIMAAKGTEKIGLVVWLDRDAVKAAIASEDDGCPMCGNPIHGDTGICPSCKEAVR